MEKGYKDWKEGNEEEGMIRKCDVQWCVSPEMEPVSRDCLSTHGYVCAVMIADEGRRSSITARRRLGSFKRWVARAHVPWSVRFDAPDTIARGMDTGRKCGTVPSHRHRRGREA